MSYVPAKLKVFHPKKVISYTVEDADEKPQQIDVFPGFATDAVKGIPMKRQGIGQRGIGGSKPSMEKQNSIMSPLNPFVLLGWNIVTTVDVLGRLLIVDFFLIFESRLCLIW